MRATLAVQLIWKFPLESILYDIMSLILLQKELNFLHQLAEKLICIALYDWIDRHAFIGDERLTEFASVYASLVAVFKASENGLELIDFIALYVFAMVSALDSEEVLSEVGNHEKLLHQTVDIAGRSQILQPTEDTAFLSLILKWPTDIIIFPPSVLS